MDSDADDAALVFRVGPNSVSGRALALRIIFCKNLKRLLLILRRIVAAKLGTIERWSFYTLRRLWQWLDPRSPHFVLAAVLCAAVLLRRQRLRSVKEVAAYQCKFWSNLMRTALTYEEWAYAASMVEKHQQSSRRKDDELYDEDLVRAKLEDLKQRRLRGDVEEIMFALRTDLLRNLGNMCNSELHKGRLQTPALIQEYISEVRYQLRAVCDADSHSFPLEEKLAFIHETRHAFGRTALMLSGGAALGAFHLGVVRTLIEHRLLPRVLSGASVGSIVCSFVATRTWTELQQFFDDPMPPIAFFESMGSIFATAHRLLTKGALAEIGQLQRKMRLFIGDLTFQEAYDLSGRVLGIPVCSVRPNEPHRLLNYLTAPHVVIWSAVTASCAFPGLFEAQELMAKDRQGRLVPYHMPTEGLPVEQTAAQKRRWRDGSLESDLPMKELRELFNVNHFIVSQANPHIAPLLRFKEACRTVGGPWAFKLASLVEMEAKHRCQQALTLGWRWGGLAKLFAQEWEGDVTIVMPATLAQFAKIIQNPTPSELRKAVIQGRRCTWERLSAIQANCGIELTLDECVSDLNQRRKHQLRSAKAAAARASLCSTKLGGGSSADASPCRDPSCCTRVGKGHSLALAALQQHALSSSWRRIPSWNRFARERSWGSLDEDNGGAQLLHSSLATGPSDLPAGVVPGSMIDYGSERSTHGGTRWLQGAGIQGSYMQHQGGHSGDSDSDTEGNFRHAAFHEGSNRGSLMRSWTRAGGPIMHSPSASCMLQLQDAALAAELVRSGAGPSGADTSDAGPAELVSPGRALHPGLDRSGLNGSPSSTALRQPIQDGGSQGLPDKGGEGSDAQGSQLPPLQGSLSTGNTQQWAPQGTQPHPWGPLSVAPSFSRWAAPGQLVPVLSTLGGGLAYSYGPANQLVPPARLSSAPPNQHHISHQSQHHNLAHGQHSGEQSIGAPGLGASSDQPSGGPASEAISQLHASASATFLASQGRNSQEQLADDWRLRERDWCAAERPMPAPTTASGEADEEGMLFGLAMESSMHGNRSVSVPVGPGPASSAGLRFPPGQSAAWGVRGNEALLLNGQAFHGGLVPPLQQVHGAGVPQQYHRSSQSMSGHAQPVLVSGQAWAGSLCAMKPRQEGPVKGGSAERLNLPGGLLPELEFDEQEGEGEGKCVSEFPDKGAVASAGVMDLAETKASSLSGLQQGPVKKQPGQDEGDCQEPEVVKGQAEGAFSPNP